MFKLGIDSLELLIGNFKKGHLGELRVIEKKQELVYVGVDRDGAQAEVLVAIKASVVLSLQADFNFHF